MIDGISSGICNQTAAIFAFIGTVATCSTLYPGVAKKNGIAALVSALPELVQFEIDIDKEEEDHDKEPEPAEPEPLDEPPEDEPYKAVRNDKVDKEMENALNRLQQKLQVQRLKEGLYLIGGKRVHIRFLVNIAMVRVGGGWEPLQSFLEKVWWCPSTYAESPSLRNRPISAYFAFQ